MPGAAGLPPEVAREGRRPARIAGPPVAPFRGRSSADCRGARRISARYDPNDGRVGRTGPVAQVGGAVCLVGGVLGAVLPAARACAATSASRGAFARVKGGGGRALAAERTSARSIDHRVPVGGDVVAICFEAAGRLAPSPRSPGSIGGHGRHCEGSTEVRGPRATAISCQSERGADALTGGVGSGRGRA